ncbi:MAG: hypothetical protein PHS14_05380 [Elusimicrobia bacterium]|nr:hypothetical protein [Elusimicrobiota bacterium]
MRALAPLLAFLLLAASAAACPFGFPGHVHASAGSPAPAAAMPEGRCTGHGIPPASEPVPVGGPAFDLRAEPIPDKERVYWEMIGYRIDDAGGRLIAPGGVVVTRAHMDALHKPFDAATERLDAGLWQAFVYSGYRLDETTCRLMGPDAKPLDRLTMVVWRETNRRQQAHAAMETLLGKLQGLDPALPVPYDVRAHMQALSSAGTELPPNIRRLPARGATTVGELRAPAAASYAESTKFFDGQRELSDFVSAAIPGSGPGVAARRKGIPDPDERKLGAALSAAFNAEMAKTAPGRELLARFRGPKGLVLPDVMVLKLTQSPNDPNAPGAQYDPSGDRMVINHWVIVSALHDRLPPEKFAKIKDRLADAGQVSKLLAEDPSLMPLFVDSLDVMYFHELTHAAQSRRNRVDDESLRGNLPGANPLAKEHEAHREHCRYLLSKNAADIDRNPWRDYCLVLIHDPAAFKDSVTQMYLSTFSGSAELDDVASRQEVRRTTSRALETGGGVRNWIEQKLKQAGFALGDAELKSYRADVDKRERDFLAGVPALRREAGAGLVAYYEKTGAADRALRLALSLPRGALDGGEARLDAIADEAVAWVARAKDPALRDARLAAEGQLIGRLNFRSRPLPAALRDAYERDARALAEELLASAPKARPVTIRPRGSFSDELNALDKATRALDSALRDRRLDEAAAWAKSLSKPGDLPARIQKARAAKTK